MDGLMNFVLELDCCTNRSTQESTSLIYLLGFRLGLAALHDLFLQGRLGKFNRLYNRYFLATYCPLHFTADEFTQTLVLRSHWTYLSFTARTASYYRFAQLYWNGSTPSPGWLQTALDTDSSIEENRGTRTAAETGTGASSSTSTPATTENSEIKEALKTLLKLLV